MQKRSEPVPRELIQRNLDGVRERIEAATRTAGRASGSVRLVAVTKYVDLAEIQILRELGVTDFGEARVQDAEKKVAATARDATLRWHLIGHLQTNKADKAAKLFSAVHSVDSLRVAQTLHKERQKLRQRSAAASLPPLDCLLEVNVAGEANKFGLAPDIETLRELLRDCATLNELRVKGLMCMAPYAEAPETTSRPVFRRLRELLGELNAAAVYPQALTQLSMGMTQDFEIAIAEGATIVRVGSALFE